MSELVRHRLDDVVRASAVNAEFLGKEIEKERDKIRQAEATIARKEAEIAKEQEAGVEAARLLGLMPSAPVEASE